MSDQHPLVSAAIWDHFEHARNVGELPDATGEGWAGSRESSRFMRIQVRLDQSSIAAATFGTYGCVPAIACGSYTTEWARGRSTHEALEFTPRQLRKALGGLPEGRRYCADLAVDALHAAVLDALQRNESRLENVS